MSPPSLPAQIVEAIKTENLAALRALFRAHPGQLEARTPFGAQTWLGYAAQIGRLNSARFLVDAGSDVNAGDARDNAKPICSAADNGHEELVSYLLESGAVLDVDASVKNPLFAAIVGRSPNIVRILLERGIDSRVSYTSPSMHDMDAVAFALMRGERECARVIAMWNADGDAEKAADALSKADAIATQNAYRRP